MVATNWGGTKQHQITKSNRFQKHCMLENNTYQKQQKIKKEQILINDKSQKTTYVKKQ